jgi:hypothetical protein
MVLCKKGDDITRIDGNPSDFDSTQSFIFSAERNRTGYTTFHFKTNLVKGAAD